MKLSRSQLWKIKLILHLLAGLPVLWLLSALFLGGLSADPAKDIQHFTGLMALRLLLLTLCISPLAHFSHTPILVRCRRLVGLWCFAWATLHVISYALLELGLDFSLLGREIITRPYLILGMLAWLILLSLTLTSTARAQQKLAAHWQSLHNLVYLVAILVPIHFIWSVKTLSPTPLIYACVAAGLLLLRGSKWRTFWQKRFHTR